MLNKLFQKAMGFLQQPKRAFDSEKGTELADGFVYLLVLSLVTAVLSGILSIFNPTIPGLFLVAIVGAYVGGIIGAVIGGLWLHLWAYIFGAKKGLHQTLKANFYGGTPTYLLGWIPIINVLAGLWSIYLYWIGLQRLQSMPGDKAALSVVIAIIIPMLVFAALFMAGLALLSSMGGMDPNMMFPGI